MIRPGRPSDSAGIRVLWDAYRAELEAAGKEYASGRADTAPWTSWLQRRIAAGDVRVGVEDGVVSAYIAWEVRSRPDGHRALIVTDLYVTPGERGHRLGGGLLARALDRARADGMAHVEVDVGLGDGAAQALVASYGFVAQAGAIVREI